MCLVCLLCLVGTVLVVLAMVRVHDPGAAIVGVDGAIDARGRLGQDPDHSIRELRMEVIALGPTMRADDLVAELEALPPGDIGADHGLERSGEQASGGQ